MSVIDTKFQNSTSITEQFKRSVTLFKKSYSSRLNSQSLEIDTGNLFDLLMHLKLVIQNVGGKYHAHDLLLLIFVECRNDVYDFQLIIDWIKTRLWDVISIKDAKMLLKFVALYRPLPSEIISEFDAFQRANEQDPLLFYTQNEICKERWCAKTDKFISERKNQIYWDQAKILERKRIGDGRLMKLVRMASSGFLHKAKVIPGDVAKAENSVNLRKAQKKFHHPSSLLTSEPRLNQQTSSSRTKTADPNLLASVAENAQISLSPVETFGFLSCPTDTHE
jgi:hypothetical protein